MTSTTKKVKATPKATLESYKHLQRSFSKFYFGIKTIHLTYPWLSWCLFLFLLHLPTLWYCFSLIPFIMAYLSPPFDCFYSPQFPCPLVAYLALITLHPLVPIHLLHDFKYGHFGNPFVFYSKVVFFDCPTLHPTWRIQVIVYYKMSILSKWRPHRAPNHYNQVQAERCLHPLLQNWINRGTLKMPQRRT